MAKTSAGLLIYRQKDARAEVLLVHPGGPFFKKKDLGAWSIPKGELEPGEEPLATARREVREEIGAEPDGPFEPLGSVTQSGGKVVIAFACRLDFALEGLKSNTFELEWPPRSGKKATFPEVDQARYFDFDAAKLKINPAQAAFVDRLAALLER